MLSSTFVTNPYRILICMKKTMFAGIGVAVLALVTGVWWYNTDMSDNPEAGWQSSQQQTKGISSEAMILDVRTPEEYAAGHAKRAENLPLQDMQSGVMPTPKKDTPIYVYCRSGNRSSQAKQLLEQNGYTNVTDIGAYENTGKFGL